MNHAILRLILTLACGAALVHTGSASAAPIQVNAMDTGAYQANGSHMATNENYITGQFLTENRSFFVFDLTGVSDPISAATLNLFNPNTNPHPCCQGYRSADATETFNLFDVTTGVDALTAGGVGRTDIFADLGTGTLFGTYVASAADNGRTISVTLNSAGVAALNAARGSVIAFGGALSTISGPGDQFVFGFSTASFAGGDVRRLDLTTADVSQVPEPASVTLLGFGLTGLAVRLRRRIAR